MTTVYYLDSRWEFKINQILKYEILRYICKPTIRLFNIYLILKIEKKIKKKIFIKNKDDNIHKSKLWNGRTKEH